MNESFLYISSILKSKIEEMTLCSWVFIGRIPFLMKGDNEGKQEAKSRQ